MRIRQPIDSQETQAIRRFPACLNLNYCDRVENQFVKQSVMLQAYFTCMKQIKNLTPKHLKNASKIFLKESWNFLK